MWPRIGLKALLQTSKHLHPLSPLSSFLFHFIPRTLQIWTSLFFRTRTRTKYVQISSTRFQTSPVHHQIPLQLRWQNPPSLSWRQASLPRRPHPCPRRRPLYSLLRSVLALSLSQSHSHSLSLFSVHQHVILWITLIACRAELLLKLEELCGASVRHLRCQLPSEDLDALISITSDEDLANLIEEYDRLSSLKIRAFLSPPRSTNNASISPSKSASLSSSSASSSSSSSSYCSQTGRAGRSDRTSAPVVDRCVHQMSPAQAYRVAVEKSKPSGRNIPLPRYGYHGSGGQVYLVHNGNHWQ